MTPCAKCGHDRQLHMPVNGNPCRRGVTGSRGHCRECDRLSEFDYYERCSRFQSQVSRGFKRVEREGVRRRKEMPHYGQKLTPLQALVQKEAQQAFNAAKRAYDLAEAARCKDCLLKVCECPPPPPDDPMVAMLTKKFEKKMKKKKKKKLNLPRAPLMTKTGGAHRVHKNVPDRKRKHKGRDEETA